MSNLIDQQWGNYRLTRQLGRGGFAEVYLGEHTRLGMMAAVKILHAHLGPEDADTFLQEARTVASLSHPHIIRVLDFDIKDNAPFLVLDYAPQGSLRQRHPGGTKVPLAQVVDYAKQVGSALQYAHERKLIHRDIKPENMLLGQQGEVLLGDFGIVAMAHSTSSMSAQASMGTITYMSPEQIQGYPRPASDQYSLAVTIYQWLTGEPPFQGSSAEVIARHIGVAPPPLRSKALEVPAAVEQVVLKALAKDPKDRFESIQAFVNALEKASQPDAQPARTEQASPMESHAALAATEIAPRPGNQQMLEMAPPLPAGYTLPAYPPPTPYYQYSAYTLYPRISDPGRKVALKYGLIGGAIISVITIALAIYFLNPSSTDSFASAFYQPVLGDYLLLGGLIISLIIALPNAVVYFCVGLLATRATGRMNTAIFACLWALLCFAIADTIASIIIYTRYPPPDLLLGVLAFVIDLFVDLLLALLLGCGAGMLGALIGKPKRQS